MIELRDLSVVFNPNTPDERSALDKVSRRLTKANSDHIASNGPARARCCSWSPHR
jgi:hypothetical protein